MSENLLIEYRVNPGSWEDVDCGAVSKSCANVLGTEFPDASWPVSVLYAEDAIIAELNQKFRKRQGPTNVLSFPSDGAGFCDVFLGDVILAYETCKREAEQAAKTISDHTTHLLIHGVLHLLGFSHEKDEEAIRMEAMETKLLMSIGITDPHKEIHENL
ncbi:MAG: rRNA maturation RNase YbeY [Marinicaulis sp.]|nr:rRNA maturation RNase YbeY [Marinicaulis sp.]NNE41662.1 rRNA maturation RNase YbeY [Marinicaulis sp.]NNL87620.1 rRNA maturation RNase YbeY [Marinicaulis sp.]